MPQARACLARAARGGLAARAQTASQGPARQGGRAVAVRPGDVGDPQVGRPERVASGARRGMFLPVPSSALEPAGP